MGSVYSQIIMGLTLSWPELILKIIFWSVRKSQRVNLYLTRRYRILFFLRIFIKNYPINISELVIFSTFIWCPFLPMMETPKTKGRIAYMASIMCIPGFLVPLPHGFSRSLFLSLIVSSGHSVLKMGVGFDVLWNILR